MLFGCIRDSRPGAIAIRERLHRLHDTGAFTGSDGHALIVRGDPATLMALSAEPEAMEHLMRLQALAEDVRFDFAVSGATVGETWPAWKQLMGA